MEIFYTENIEGGMAFLGEEESAHCVKVLRHRSGDLITVVDGLGTMYECRLTGDSPKAAVASVTGETTEWNAHPYVLDMAVCPTKNNDRFEWFAEKATEVGLDIISPIIGERSERKVFKPERTRKVVLSAMKQSLKAKLPTVEEPVSVKDFLRKDSPETPHLKLICYCFEGQEAERKHINTVLDDFDSIVSDGSVPRITVMIGPEGDFSPEEASLAISRGYVPVHLGPSRLRTETAAITAATAVYLHFLR